MLSLSGWCLIKFWPFQEAARKWAVFKVKHICGYGFHIAVLQCQIWVVVVALLDQLHGLCLCLNWILDLIQTQVSKVAWSFMYFIHLGPCLCVLQEELGRKTVTEGRIGNLENAEKIRQEEGRKGGTKLERLMESLQVMWICSLCRKCKQTSASS